MVWQSFTRFICEHAHSRSDLYTFVFLATNSCGIRFDLLVPRSFGDNPHGLLVVAETRAGSAQQCAAFDCSHYDQRMGGHRRRSSCDWLGATITAPAVQYALTA